MKIELIENTEFGFYNIKFGTRPDYEHNADMLNELKANGWAWSRHNGVWYPRTNEAKAKANDFAAEFAKKYNEPDKSFGQELFERSQRIDQWKKEHLPQEQNNKPVQEETKSVELNDNQKKVYELLKATNNFSEIQILEMVSKIDTAYQTENFDIPELSWEEIKSFIHADDSFDLAKDLRDLYNPNISETNNKINVVYNYLHDFMDFDVLGENQYERSADAEYHTMRESVRHDILQPVCENIVMGRYSNFFDMQEDFISRRESKIADISKSYMENPAIKEQYIGMKRAELIEKAPEMLKGREFNSWIFNVDNDGHFLFYESNGYLKSEFLNDVKYNAVKDFLVQVEELDLLEESSKQLKEEYAKMHSLLEKPPVQIQEELIAKEVEEELANADEEIDTSVSEYNDLGIDTRTGEPWNREENEDVSEPEIQEEESTELTQADLDNVTKVIPENQYQFMLENAAGEEAEYFKQKLKNMATICADLQKHSNKENVNKDGSHPCKLHYFLGNCDWYISELDNDGIGFGYCILDGDLYSSEWGSVNVCGDSTYEQPLTKMAINVPIRINGSEFNRSVSPELDLHLDEDTTIERELYKLDNEYFADYKKYAEKDKKILAKSSEVSINIIEETNQELEVENGSKTDIGYERRAGISSGSNLNQGLEEPGAEADRGSDTGRGQRILHSEREENGSLENSEGIPELHTVGRESEISDLHIEEGLSGNNEILHSERSSEAGNSDLQHTGMENGQISHRVRTVEPGDGTGVNPNEKTSSEPLHGNEEVIEKEADELFKKITEQYDTQYKDFYDTYNKMKESYTENESRYVSDARIGDMFRQVHRELVSLQMNELTDLIKQAPNVDIARINATRYFNFCGQDEFNYLHDNLYLRYHLGDYTKDSGRRFVAPTVEELQNFINETYNSLHGIVAEKETPVYNINGTEYTQETIETLITEDIQNVLNELDPAPVIEGIRLYQNPEQTGKVNILLQYNAKENETNWREDDLFNAVMVENLTFNGMPVDVNPITPEKSGTIEQYLEHFESLGVTNENEAIVKQAKMLDEQFDFAKLADDICQQSYEQSGAGFNYYIYFEEIAGLAGKDVAWVKENIETIGEALEEHNDELLLDFNLREALEEDSLDLNFCSVGEDTNELFKKDDSGRWVRKTDKELAYERAIDEQSSKWDELESAFTGLETFRGNFEEIKREVFEQFLDKGKRFNEAQWQEETIYRLLEENIDFGALTETAEELEAPNHSVLMEQRSAVLEDISSKIVSGEITAADYQKYYEEKYPELFNSEIKVKPYDFFINDVANLDLGIGAEIDPITGLSAEKAALKYAELKDKGLSPYIGINIPGDFIFDDKEGQGAGIFTETNGHPSFYMGDNFVKDLKKNDEHAKTVISAYKELYAMTDKYILGVQKPEFVFEKEKELFGNQETHTLTNGTQSFEMSFSNKDVEALKERYEEAKNLTKENGVEAHADWIEVYNTSLKWQEYLNLTEKRIKENGEKAMINLSRENAKDFTNEFISAYEQKNEDRLLRLNNGYGYNGDLFYDERDLIPNLFIKYFTNGENLSPDSVRNGIKEYCKNQNIEKSTVNETKAKLAANIDWSEFTEDAFNKTKADMISGHDGEMYGAINVGQLCFELVPQDMGDRMDLFTNIYYPKLYATYGEDSDGVKYDTAIGLDIDSETFTKMSYEEFKEYFANTVLPSSLDNDLTERALKPTEDWNTIWEELNKNNNYSYMFPESFFKDSKELNVYEVKYEGTFDFESDGICQVVSGDKKTLEKIAHDYGYELHPDYLYHKDDLDLDDRNAVNDLSFRTIDLADNFKSKNVEVISNPDEIKNAISKLETIIKETYLTVPAGEESLTHEELQRRYDKWTRPMARDILEELKNGNQNIISLINDFDINKENHKTENSYGTAEQLFKRDVQYNLMPALYKEVQNKIIEKYNEDKTPYVLLNWSESPEFPIENKVYTLKEFNELLTQADKEFHNRKEYAEKKYGSADNYWNLQDAGKLPDEDKNISFGYDKTDFKLFNLPNIENPEDTYSYEASRYDIGDGDGSVFDFIRTTCSHDVLIESCNKVEREFYYPDVTEAQQGFVENSVKEESEVLKKNLVEKMKALDIAEEEYDKLHKQWLINSLEAEAVDKHLEDSLAEIKSTYDNSISNLYTKVLNEYPFASTENISDSQFMLYVANEAKKMVISELYLPSRESAKDYTKYTGKDWEKFRKIFKQFPSKVNMTEYVENILQEKCNEKGYSVSENIEHEEEAAIQLTSKKDIKAIREKCREILQKPDSEITEADKVILAQYEGAGGIKEDNRTVSGILNEFYTPNNLVEKVWQIVDAYAPNAKTVLEPSAGVGKFANNRPNNEFTMHELDETSARINKILHPEANVIQGAYQKQFFDAGERIHTPGQKVKYDVIIGNPPYGTYNDKYKGLGEGKEFDRYEEYFISKGLDALKDENSIMAFVVPSGFLNTASDKQKEIISSKGHLIDAYRLPEKTFPTTEVGTDIIIMQNLEKIKKSLKYGEYISKGMAEGVALDELSNGNWFKQHPEKILGEVKTRTNRFGKQEEYVTAHEGLTIQDELNKIDSMLPKVENVVSNENNILRTPKSYPYINEDGTLNPDRLNNGDIIIDKEDGIPYKVDMLFGNQFMRVVSISVIKGNTELFEELEEKSRSDEQTYELGTGWKEVLNERFSAPTKEQLNNWKYPSWYQKHLNEQEEYESERDSIRQPVLKILEQSKKGMSVNKDELVRVYAETLAKELDFICHHNDIAFEERINPATKEKTKFLSDEYGYARIDHEIPEICDFYGSDLVKGIIYNSVIHFSEDTENDTYLRLQKTYPAFFNEQTKNLSVLESIKDVSCSKEYAGTKERGNSVWDLAREYLNNVRDKSIDENHLLINVIEANVSTTLDFSHTKNESVAHETEKSSNSNLVMTEEDNKRMKGFTYKNMLGLTATVLPAKEQLEENIYYVIGGLENSMNDNPDDWTPYTKEKLREEVTAEIYDMVSDGNGSVDYADGICSHLKFLGNDYIYSVIDKIGSEAGILVEESIEKQKEQNIVKPENQPAANKEQTVSQDIAQSTEVVEEELDDPKKRLYEDPDGVFKTKHQLTREEFAKFYTGANFTQEDYNIWGATDWKGNVDTSKLTEAELSYLKTSDNYVETNEGVYTNAMLYATGNIYQKLDELEENKENLSSESYEKAKAILTNAIPKVVPIENIKIDALSPLAQEFKVHREVTSSRWYMGRTELQTVELDIDLREDFINWATNCSSLDNFDENNQSINSRRSIYNYSSAKISREDIPEDISWTDIVNYIDRVPVPTHIDEKNDTKEVKNKKNLIAGNIKDARKNTCYELFNRYIQEGLPQEDKERLQSTWNKIYNATVHADYKKLPLFIDGMSTFKGEHPFMLYKQQVEGVSRLLSKGNGLLAYEVGVGKTAAGIVTTMGQLQTGRCKRPLIIVPNQVYKKWVKDFRELFPDVKINELYNLSEKYIDKHFDERTHSLLIEPGSVTIITDSALQKITFSDAVCSNELAEDFSYLLGVSDALHSGDDKEKATAYQKIQNEIGKASRVQVKKLPEGREQEIQQSYIFFDECGFDNVVIDEAHRYKNLFTIPRPKRGDKGAREFEGLGTGKPSIRAEKVFGITTLIQRRNEDRNVFLLTATPFTNNPLEVYSMLSYMGRKELINRHIYDVRDFCTEFAQTKFEYSVKPTGDIEPKQVMKNFRGQKKLKNLVFEYIDAVSAKEAGIERPEGERHPIYLELSPLQQRIIKLEQDAIAASDNPYVTLKAMTTMRTCTLSPALLEPDDFASVEDIVIPPKSQIVESSPKLSWVCNTVADLYKQKPECGQFIYMPQGKDYFDEVKSYLIKQGIPEDAIDYIHSTHNGSAEDKDKISARFNNKEDKLKILIGTATVAEGIDLNGNSIVEYNTMLGWNPTESIQVEGRIWRQGNEQGKVHIMYPLMENSIDALIYQKHDEKASRINSVLSKTDDGKDAIDTDEINPETIKFELITDPTKKVKMIIDEKTAEKRKEIKVIDNRLETIQELEEDRQNCKTLYDTNVAEKEKYKSLLKTAREELKADPNNWQKEARVTSNERAVDTCNKEIAKAKNRLNTISYNFNKFDIHEPEREVPIKLQELITKKAELEADITDIENSKDRLIADEQKKLLEKKILSKPVEELRKEWVEYVNKNTWYKKQNDKSKDRNETVQEPLEAIKDFKVPDVMIKNLDKAMAEMDFKVLHNYLNWGDRDIINDCHENDKAIVILRERYEKTKGVKLPEQFRKTTEYLVSVCDEKTLPEVCKFKSMEDAVAYACSSWHGEAYQRDGYVEYVTLDNFKKNRDVSALAKDLQKREGQSYHGFGSPNGFGYDCSPKGVKIEAFINKKREEFFVNWNQVAKIKAKQWNREYPAEFSIKDEPKREGEKDLKNVQMVQQDLFDFDEVKVQTKTLDIRMQGYNSQFILSDQALENYHGLPPFIKKSDNEWVIRCKGEDFAKPQEGIASYELVDVSLTKEQLQGMVNAHLFAQQQEISHKKFDDPEYKGKVICPKPEVSDMQKELLKSNGISDNDLKKVTKENFNELLCEGEKPILKKKLPQPKQLKQENNEKLLPSTTIEIAEDTDFDYDY